MKKSSNQKSILSEWLEQADKLKKERNLRKERKLLYYSRNGINPKIPDNAWIDPKGKIYPLKFGEHESFASDWVNKNTLGYDLIFMHHLNYNKRVVCYHYHLLELLGWVKIHDHKIMCKKGIYPNGKVYYSSLEFELELSDKTISRINLLLKKNKEYEIYE